MAKGPDASVRALRRSCSAGSARERRVRRSTHEQDGDPQAAVRPHGPDSHVPVLAIKDVVAMWRTVHERSVQAPHVGAYSHVLAAHRPAVVIEHAAETRGVVDVPPLGHLLAVALRLPRQARRKDQLLDSAVPSRVVVSPLKRPLRRLPRRRGIRRDGGQSKGCCQEKADPTGLPASKRGCEHSRASRPGRWWVPTPEPEGPGPSVARPPSPGGGEVRSFASRRSRRFAVSGPHALPCSAASSAPCPSSFSSNCLRGRG